VAEPCRPGGWGASSFLRTFEKSDIVSGEQLGGKWAREGGTEGDVPEEGRRLSAELPG